MAIVFAQIPFDIFDLRFSELRALEVTLRENFNFNDSGIRFTDAVVLDDGARSLSPSVGKTSA